MWTRHACFVGVTSKDIPDKPAEPLTRCASNNDGDCNHAQCPQHRDKEPETTGRSCPLYNWDREDY